MTAENKNRKFVLTVNIKKDNKTEKENVKFEIDPKKFDEESDIEQKVTIKGKEYTLKGKAHKGWFWDDINDLKILEGATEKNEELKPTLKAEDWRVKGPIGVVVLVVIAITALVWWWKSSNNEDKEEEGL